MPLHPTQQNIRKEVDVLDLSNNDALAVAIVDGSGNQVTSFGGSGGTSSTDDAAFTAGSTAGTPMMGAATSDAVDANDLGVVAIDTNRNLKVSIEVDNVGIGGGTQYTEGTIDASITGTAVLAEGPSDTLTPLQVDASSHLQVDLAAASVTVPVQTEVQLDFDTDVGTESLSLVGVGLPAAGGAVAGGTATNPIQVSVANTGANATPVVVDLGANNDVTVTGTVDLGATDNAVLDSIATNTTNLNNCIVQDDAPFTPATGYLMMVGGEFDDAAPDSVNEGDAGNFRISGNRSLYVQIRDGAGNERGLNVDASGQIATTLATLPDTAAGDLAAVNSNTDTLAVVGGGTEATALRVTLASDSTGVVSVDDNAGSLTVDNAGTFAVQVDGSALTALQLIDNPVVAHDAAVSGSTGVMVAGFEARSTASTAVADGDAVRAIASTLGKQVTLPYAIPAATWSYAAASGGVTNTTGVTAKAAGTGSERHYITSAQIINGHATVSTDVQIRDGASGTVLFRGFAQAAGGGVSAKFDPPLRGSAATLVEVACGTTGSATYFNLQGYTAAE